MPTTTKTVWLIYQDCVLCGSRKQSVQINEEYAHAHGIKIIKKSVFDGELPKSLAMRACEKHMRLPFYYLLDEDELFQDLSDIEQTEDEPEEPKTTKAKRTKKAKTESEATDEQID